MIRVAIYINIPYSDTLAFTADTTNVTADTTLYTADATLKAVSSYDYQRLDLFSDEKISVTSMIQDISDISKTKTDYSQSFTIPASKRNNRIFSYWENNKIDGYDARQKIKGYITVDGVVFRKGVIQLEKSNLKNGVVENYSITFFGSLVSLKDTFNGLFLKDLKAEQVYNFNYSGSVVQTKISTVTNDDVKFPLITSARPWNLTGTGVNAINVNATAMSFKELFPALRLSAVLHMIETQFGINFNGTFLNNVRFLNAFLYLKNSDVFTPKFVGSPIISSSVTYGANVYSTWTVSTNTFNYVNPIPFSSGSDINVSLVFSANCNLSFVGTKVYVDVFYNGNYFTSNETEVFASGSNGRVILSLIGSFFGYNANNYNNGAYTFSFSCAQNISFNSCLINYSANQGIFPSILIESIVVTVPNFTSNSKVDVSSIMPDMKIEDFVSGLMKMFNLTIWSDTENVYNIETLEDYYKQGKEYDISEYVTIDNIDVERVKWYKKISFTYQKSETYFSQIFLGGNGRSYADLIQSYDNNDNDYTISLPFESPLMSNLNNSGLVVGYSLSNSLAPQKTKPVILYEANPTSLASTSSSFFFNNGTSTSSLNNYVLFGNETRFGNTFENATLNWGEERSVYTGDVLSDSLYQRYYLNYLKNIYDKKARLLKIKTILPLKILSKLKLNDRLLIKDRKYIINSFTTDLTTSEVNMELITDLRIAQRYITTLFVDDFCYPNGVSLVDNSDWEGTNNNSKVLVNSFGLSFNGYKGSNICNSFQLKTGSNAQNIYRIFNASTSGKTITAYMVNTNLGAGSYVNNTPQLFSSISEGPNDTKYGNLSYTIGSSFGIQFYTFGLSATSLTTQTVTTNGLSGTFLIMTEYNSTDNKYKVWLTNTANDIPFYAAGYLLNYTTPDMEVTLPATIAPQCIHFFQQPTGVLTDITVDGLRIAEDWDIKQV